MPQYQVMPKSRKQSLRHPCILHPCESACLLPLLLLQDQQVCEGVDGRTRMERLNRFRFDSLGRRRKKGREEREGQAGFGALLIAFLSPSSFLNCSKNPSYTFPIPIAELQQNMFVVCDIFEEEITCRTSDAHLHSLCYVLCVAAIEKRQIPSYRETGSSPFLIRA